MAGSIPTYDYEVEKDALLRKQKIADAMLSQSLSPMEIQQVGPVAAQVNPWQGVAKVLQGYMAGREADGIKVEKDALSERYKSDLSSGMNDFMRVYQGYEAPESPSEGAAMVQVPGDKKRAILEAIASNHPVLQALGMKQLESLNKGEDLGEVGGIVYDKGNRQIVTLGGAQPQLEMQDGDLYEVNPSTKQRKKLDTASRVTVNNRMPSAESTFDREFGGAEGKRLSTDLAMRTPRIGMLNSISKGKSLLDQGIFTGIAAPIAKNASKLGTALFQGDPEKAARTEQFVAEIGSTVIPRLKELGGNDTDEERKYLEGIQGGNIMMEETALRRILESAESKIAQHISDTDKAAEVWRGKGKAIPTSDPFIPTPPTPAQPPKLRKYNPVTKRIE